MPVGNKFAESQGLNYVPNDVYLQEGFKGSTPLDFSNLSSSGIMSQATIPRPLQYIPQGGEGDGPPTGPAPDLGEVTADDYGYGVVGDMGMTEEEQAGVDSIKNAKISKMDMVKAGLATAFMGPIAGATSLYKSQKKAKEEAIAAAKAAQQQRDFDAAKANQNQGIASQLGGSDGTSGGNYTGGAGFASANAYGGDGTMDDLGADGFAAKDGGRAGYFFGGRVNFKAGGRTGYKDGYSVQDDMGDYAENVGKEAAPGGGFVGDGGNNNNNNNNPPPTFYDNGVQIITDQSKLGYNYPTGLTKNLGIGQLTAILDAKKSLEEEEPEGMIQYDSSVGPFDTRATFDTTTGPEFNANYTGNNFGVDVNSKTGLSGGYSKEIGPGTFTLGGNLRPDGTYNTEAKYGITFANGGLASIL